MSKLRLATVWLDGCSGCHMSFLDMDERLLDLAELVDVVYSPIVDTKDYPDYVDIALVEGAVASVDDEKKIQKIRAHTKLLVAMGDCAVTGNVPSMRNNIPVEELLRVGYIENATDHPGPPTTEVPKLEPKVIPLQELVPVDLFVPGCPPPAGQIYYVLSEVLAGRTPELATKAHFGN